MQNRQREYSPISERENGNRLHNRPNVPARSGYTGDGVKLGEPGHCPGTESQQAGDSGQNQAGCKKSKRTDFLFCPFRRLVLGGGGF